MTVDRAYLLASPGMDRSLTYVGMTRHREATTLFAGAEDFTDRSAGRLVSQGLAPYENDPENPMSYFVTLENDKGERHTVWGVDLKRAVAESGAKVGDRIGLDHRGADQVQLPDGQTVQRNRWHVRMGSDLAHGKLAQVLGRDRPKESTLDFADRRGLDGESVVRRWIERGREKVAALAGRAQRAIARTLERKDEPAVEHPQEIEDTAERQASGVAERMAALRADKMRRETPAPSRIADRLTEMREKSENDSGLQRLERRADRIWEAAQGEHPGDLNAAAESAKRGLRREYRSHYQSRVLPPEAEAHFQLLAETRFREESRELHGGQAQGGGSDGRMKPERDDDRPDPDPTPTPRWRRSRGMGL